MDGDMERESEDREMASFYQDLYGVVNPYGGLPGSSMEANDTNISPYGESTSTISKVGKKSGRQRGATMDNFLTSVLGALSGGGGSGAMSNGFFEGDPGADPITGQPMSNSLGLGDVLSTVADIIKGKRDKKLINQAMQGAGRHATWLQDIAANPPHPAWVDVARGK